MFELIVENVTNTSIFEAKLKEAFNENKQLLTVDKFKNSFLPNLVDISVFDKETKKLNQMFG